MAQYNQTAEQLTDNIESSTIDHTTQQAITNILANVEGDTIVHQLEEGEVPIERADVILTNGVDIGDTDVPTIIISGTEAVTIEINSSTENGERAIVGGDGGDSVSVQSNDAVTLDAGGGDDSVTTGSGSDVVSGGAGDDSVNTGAGADSVVVGEGADSVDTGSGFDVISTTLASDEVDFMVTEDGQVVITNLATGEATLVDNAEYVEFDDGVAHIVAGSDTDDVLDNVLGGTEDANLLAMAGFVTDNLDSLIGDYLASDTFQQNSQGVTNLNNLVELTYEGALNTDLAPDILEGLVDVAKNNLANPSEELAGFDEGLDVVGQSRSFSGIDLGEL